MRNTQVTHPEKVWILRGAVPVYLDFQVLVRAYSKAANWAQAVKEFNENPEAPVVYTHYTDMMEERL